MVEGARLESVCTGSTCTVSSNLILSARKTMELFPDVKKLESSTKDPCRSFLFAQGLTNKALTQKGFGTIYSCETQKTMELFVGNLKHPLNCHDKFFVFQV